MGAAVPKFSTDAGAAMGGIARTGFSAEENSSIKSMRLRLARSLLLCSMDIAARVGLGPGGQQQRESRNGLREAGRRCGRHGRYGASEARASGERFGDPGRTCRRDPGCRHEPRFDRHRANRAAPGRCSHLSGRADLDCVAGTRPRDGQFRPAAAAMARTRRQQRQHGGELGVCFHRQSDRERGVWRSPRHRAHQLRHGGTGGCCCKNYRDRRSQDDRLRGDRPCRTDHGFRQGRFVQLDGLPRDRRGDDHQFNYRQDRDGVYAGIHFLRAGLRAFGGEYVHHPDRHDDGRQGNRRRLVAVEPNSGHARQSRRWIHFHRPCDLPHAQAAYHGARALDRAEAGAGGMSGTEIDLRLATDQQAGDFEPEQKRYLEGFVAGLQIAKAAKAVAGGGAAAPSPATGPAIAEPGGPEAAALKAQNRVLAAGGKLSDPEKFKREEHPFDTYDRLKTHAAKGEFPKPPDNFRWRFFGLFYVAPNQNAYMCRLRLPNGILKSAQLVGVADLAERFGGGYAHITTRANLQIREIAASNAVAMIDTRPYAREWHFHILNDRSLYGLPRKFNVAFDGAGVIPALEDTNDIGF